MLTRLLIAALILSTGATAWAANTRGLIVRQPAAVQQAVAVPVPTYQTQAAPSSVAPQPRQHLAINGTHTLPTAPAQPQASRQRMQMQVQQQQMQRQRVQLMQAQRMRQQQEMQRQQMARDNSFDEKVDTKVEGVTLKLREKLVGATFK